MSTNKNYVAEAVRQMIDGDDYTKPERIIEDLSPDDAVRKPDHGPYSIATIAWHTWFWINVWIVQITGVGDETGGYDYNATWPEIDSKEWQQTRDKLIESLNALRNLSENVDLDKTTTAWHTNGETLLKAAVHTAYHIGQITLVRLELGLWPPKGGE